MTNRFCKWLRSRLYPRPQETDAAVALAREVALSARVVTDHLQPFASAPNPIVALMTDLHQRRQTDETFGSPQKLRVAWPG